jgi:hypothetical protein
VELLERLAALTPRPRINLVLYYGVLGARSAWRARLQAHEPETATAGSLGTIDVTSSSRPAPPIPARANRLWAELMQRSFGVDVLLYPRCGDRLELVALIQDPTVIARILKHLGLPTEVPTARPARPPPLHPTSGDDVKAPPLPRTTSCHPDSTHDLRNARHAST